MEDDGEAEVNPMHDEWIQDIPSGCSKELQML
jgi:hypothetical protein